MQADMGQVTLGHVHVKELYVYIYVYIHTHIAGPLWFREVIHYSSQLSSVTELPMWLSKESTCQYRRCRFDPWVRKISWRKKWQPTLSFKASILWLPECLATREMKN